MWRPRRTARRTAGWTAVVLGLGLLSGCGGGDGSDGPLRFVDGSVAMMLVPLPGPAFFSLHGCLEEPGAAEVRLLGAAPEQVRGTDRIRFRAAWTAPDEALRIGAGPLRMMEPQYAALSGSSGEVRSCEESEVVSRGLDIAVILPEATRHGVVVDGVRVDYEIDGERHVARIDAVLGICPQDPVDLAGEPESCRESA